MNFTPEELIAAFKLRDSKLVGENLMCSCPFANQFHLGGDDRRRSFGISIKTGQWNCLACGERGSTIRTLAFVLKMLLPDDLMSKSLQLESNNAGIAIKHKIIYDMSINDKFALEYGRAFSLLGYRGISMAAIKRFKVGFNKGTGAITFPSIDSKKCLTGWVERNEQWSNRYAFRPDKVSREFMLFGLDRHIKECYLVEGPTDALKLISWHIEGVATFGNKIFDEQAKIIFNNCETIILVPDRDVGGDKWRKEARKLFKGKICMFEILVDTRYGDVGHPNLSYEEFSNYSKVFIG